MKYYDIIAKMNGHADPILESTVSTTGEDIEKIEIGYIQEILDIKHEHNNLKSENQDLKDKVYDLERVINDTP